MKKKGKDIAEIVDVEESADLLENKVQIQADTGSDLIELGCIKVPLEGEINAREVLKDIMEREAELRTKMAKKSDTSKDYSGQEGNKTNPKMKTKITTHERSTKFKRLRDNFAQILSLYGLDRKESLIISSLAIERGLGKENQTKPPPLPDWRFSSKEISRLSGLKGPPLYKALNRLREKGWVKLVQKNPTYYSLLSPGELNKKLQEYISETQILLEKLTEISPKILELYGNLLEGTIHSIERSLEDLKMGAQLEPAGVKSKSDRFQGIPANLQNFIKEILVRILSQIPSINILKYEANRTAGIKRGYLTFKLSTIDLVIREARTVFAGIQFYQLMHPPEDADLLQELHSYARDMLKMEYKMASKGYMKERTERKDCKYEIREILEEDNPIYLSTDNKDDKGPLNGTNKEIINREIINRFIVHLPSKLLDDDKAPKLMGYFYTCELEPLPGWIIGIWSEDPQTFSTIRDCVLNSKLGALET